VRTRSSASGYFNRTLTTPTNNKIWTWSAWVKRGILGTQQFLLNADNGSATSAAIDFLSDAVRIYFVGGVYQVTTTQVFRDPSAWYHIIFAIDTTQATDTNRVKVYVNGNQVTSFATAVYPLQNLNGAINSAVIHTIAYNGVSVYFDGYLTEVNFVDGQQLTPSSFGTTNPSTGVWQPAKYTGTYGTNGFYLNFSDNSSNTATTIGKDYSGNGNNWTPNNISVTAGVTYDSMTDVPTLTSATAANWCVWNPLAVGTNITTASGNLNATASSASNAMLQGTFGITSGKWYWEVTLSSGTSFWGGSIIKSTVGLNYSSLSSGDAYSYSDDGKKYNGQTATTYGNTYTTNDLVSVAYNADTGKIWFGKNGTWQASGDPSAGTNEAFSGISGTYMPSALLNNATGIANFGQRPFSYTPPTGFVALNTYNLPASTITNGAAYMAATLYTGNSPSSQTVSNAVNSVSFQPDLVWQKSRTQTYSNVLYDSVRGVQKRLSSNETAAESTASTAVTAFTSSGFTTGADGEMNDPTGGSNNHVAWQWKAGGTAVSNTAGSIKSQVSVGATQGFSVVTYTGGATGTVGHGLGVTPSMIIVKNRTGTADNWYVWHGTFTATEGIDLNLTDAKATGIQWWNSTLPTSSVFSVKTGGYGTANSGSTYVAYCFAAVAGYSAFGSYVGNGSADGPFVYTGFRPRFVMIKDATNASTQWTMLDSSRNTSNLVDLRLIANLSNSESQQSFVDFTSNGFKVRDTNITPINTSGATVIYMAFAENPFKNSLAR
jgi:hypothetical protein